MQQPGLMLTLLPTLTLLAPALVLAPTLTLLAANQDQDVVTKCRYKLETAVSSSCTSKACVRRVKRSSTEACQTAVHNILAMMF